MKILQLVLIAVLFALNLALISPPANFFLKLIEEDTLVSQLVKERERQEACEKCPSKCDKVPACPTLKPAPVPVCPTLKPVTDAIILPKEEKGFLEKVLDFILGIGNDQTAEKNKLRSFEPRNIEKIEKTEKKK